jgi:hypothetical protein
MNSLFIGDTTDILAEVRGPFLLLDDGPLIEQLPTRKVFDVTKHSINILKGVDYRRARDLVAITDAIYPEGANTLSKKNSTYALLLALCNQPKSLHTLFRGMPLPLKTTVEAILEAQQKIDTLLLSPILRSVLTKEANFRMDGVVLARLSRAELGDFDCFALGHFLISLYKGQVVIPDFGFYGRSYLTYLIREERLICGVRALAQLPPDLRQEVLLIPDKQAKNCTYEDAVTFGNYLGKNPNLHEYNDFIKSLVSPA